MYDYLTARGMNADRLLLEDGTTIRYRSIENARALIEGRTLDRAVVTSDYYLARARVLMVRGRVGRGRASPRRRPIRRSAWRCIVGEYCSILGLMLTGRWRAARKRYTAA